MTERIEIVQTLSVKRKGASEIPLFDPYILSPLDQLVPHFIPVATAFIYPPSTQPSIPFDKLRHALELTLECYPYLSGRLFIQSESGEAGIRDFDAGAGLIEARSASRLSQYNSNLDSLSLSDFPNQANNLFAPFNIDTVLDEPILSIQHTRFACGGVCLGIKISHRVCDAEGFFQFTRDLARVYREDGDGTLRKEITSIAPFLHGYPSSEEERQDAVSRTPTLYSLTEETIDTDRVPEVKKENSPVKDTPPTLAAVTGRFLTSKSTALETIKNEATRGDEWVSTFEAASAFIYQHVHRARHALRQLDLSIPPISSTDFLTSINLRSKLDTPPRYPYNAVSAPWTHVPSDDLLKGDLSTIARYIHRMNRSDDWSPSRTLQTFQWVAAQRDKTKIQTGFKGGNGILMISSWFRLDMYEGMTFEGRPLLVATPFTPISSIDGLGYFLPTKTQGMEDDRGDILLCLALDDRLWDILGEDTKWARAFRAES